MDSMDNCDRQVESFVKAKQRLQFVYPLTYNIKIKLMEGGRKPQYKTNGAACCDCYARIEPSKDNPTVDYVTIFPGERALIPLGFAIELPEGYEAVIRPRSGLMKLGIDECIGTVDWDYRGEVSACLVNNSKERFKVFDGDRICQMKIQPARQFGFKIVDELSETERGGNGFGSTGI